MSNEQLSFTNPQIQRLRRLLGRRSARSDEGVFVIEGPGLIDEAVRAGWEFEAQFVAPGAEPVDGAGPVRVLAEGVLERVATTESPQPVLAVVRQRAAPIPLASGFLIVADRLGDPGNLGTILRSAEASGAAGVVLTSGSVDPYNPKVVRASAGALFHVPIASGELADLRRGGWRLVGTSSHLGQAYTALELSQPVAIVMGNEAHGLSTDADVDLWINIPHHGRAESLNVAMAATVICFDIARRRNGPVQPGSNR